MSRLPTLTPRELIAALKRDGFVESRQKGSHIFLWHPVKNRMTTVAIHPGDLKRGVVKAILGQADLTEEQLRDLL